jgi:hypothetical protein
VGSATTYTVGVIVGMTLTTHGIGLALILLAGWAGAVAGYVWVERKGWLS